MFIKLLDIRYNFAYTDGDIESCILNVYIYVESFPMQNIRLLFKKQNIRFNKSKAYEHDKTSALTLEGSQCLEMLTSGMG